MSGNVSNISISLCISVAYRWIGRFMTILNRIRYIFTQNSARFLTMSMCTLYIYIKWIVIISFDSFLLTSAFHMLFHCTIFHHLPSVFMPFLVAVVIDVFCYFLVSLSLSSSSSSLLLLTFFNRSSFSSLHLRVCYVCIFSYLRSRYAVSCSCNSNVDQMKWMAKSSQTESERTHVVTRVSVFDIIRMFIRFFIS